LVSFLSYSSASFLSVCFPDFFNLPSYYFFQAFSAPAFSDFGLAMPFKQLPCQVDFLK
jgi:hypothetical protein